jgi:undecaprenyl-diphosphatase
MRRARCPDVNMMGMSKPGTANISPQAVARITLLSVSLVIAVLALLLFAWLAQEVLRGHAVRFDAYIRGVASSWSSPALTRVMRNITLLGSVLVLASASVSAGVIFLAVSWPRGALWIALAMIGGVLLDLALKYSFHRPRPAPFFGIALPNTPSFPSGHALLSFCFYGVLAALLMARVRGKILRIAIWVAASLLIGSIGFSRIYLGVHYPTDVIAGYLAAAFWVTGLTAADRYRQRRAARRDVVE